MSSLHEHAFDAIAPSYDESFGHAWRAMSVRKRVWSAVDELVEVRSRILDIGCGTGIDALHFLELGHHVTCLDPSAAMLDITFSKVTRYGPENYSLVLGTLESIRSRKDPPFSTEDRYLESQDRYRDREALAGQQFDLIFSNFGAINCQKDFAQLKESFDELLTPDGVVALVPMGPFYAWESLDLLLQGRLRAATRRLRPGRRIVDWGQGALCVSYPSPRSLDRVFEGVLVPIGGRPSALGSILPSPGRFDRIDLRPRILHALARADEQIQHWPGMALISDHYLRLYRRA